VVTVDLDAVARAAQGTLHLLNVDRLTRVEGLLTTQDDYVPPNRENGVILVLDMGDLPDWLERERKRDEPREGAVIVTPRSLVSLGELLEEEEQQPAIVGASLTGDSLRWRIQSLLAEDAAAHDRIIVHGLRAMTRTARIGGVPAVVSELANRIEGWAVLLDAQGHLMASARAGRLHIDDALAVAFGRQVRVRHKSIQTHQVGTDGDLAGYLVVASREHHESSHKRDLAAHAAGLIDLIVRKQRPKQSEMIGRELLLESLLNGRTTAEPILQRWGIPTTPLAAFALSSPARISDLNRLLHEWIEETNGEDIFALTQGVMLGFVREDLIPSLSAFVTAQARERFEDVHLGVGEPVPVEHLRRSAGQAIHALQVARNERVPVRSYSALPSITYVVNSLNQLQLTQLSGVLGRLVDSTAENQELLRTLEFYLLHHGVHRATAAALGIHRQTLVSRLSVIEEATEVSLDTADGRATLWLALRALPVK